MAYLLLLALVYSFAIALLFFQFAIPKKSTALATFGVGFALLAIGYAAQIVLGFELNEGAARFFYLARWMLAIAWFGHGLLLSVVPDHKLITWAGRGLVLASFFGLGLVALTQITNAEDWFQPASTIYSQIGDLLATNRPTRWLAILLNLYGFVALVGMAIYMLLQRQTGSRAFLIILGAILMANPLVWSPSVESPAFYALELIAPILLFLGTLKFLQVDRPRQKTKRRRAAA